MAHKAFGTTFSYLTGSTYTAVGEVVSVSPPGITSGTVDTTNMAATGDARTFLNTLIDGGSLSVELNFEPDSGTDTAKHHVLVGHVGGAVQTYRITFPDTGATTLTFSACATGFEAGELTLDGKLTATFTAKVTGAHTWA